MTIAVKRKKIIALLKAIDIAMPEVWARKIVPESKNACPICGDKPNDITRYNKETQDVILKGKFKKGRYKNFAEVAAACGI